MQSRACLGVKRCHAMNFDKHSNSVLVTLVSLVDAVMTIFPALNIVSLSETGRIFTTGQRRFSSQRFCYPKMRQEDSVTKKGPNPKPRGHPRDSPDVRISKSLSWLLRHGAEKASLNIRQDGYAKVSDVVSPQLCAMSISRPHSVRQLSTPMFRDVTFQHLQDIVKRDQKSRYHLLFEPQTSESAGVDVWWIRANQGHSMKVCHFRNALQTLRSVQVLEHRT